MRVAALAGRRIDAIGSTPAFPASRIKPVRAAIRRTLQRARISRLICSAACGADLLALDEAAGLGITTRIILPFAPARFLRSSVADRPGDWPRLFDRAMLQAGRDVIVLGGRAGAPYHEVTARLIGEAVAEAGSGRAAAIVVWEGKPRGAGDHSAEFVTLARAAGCHFYTVCTHTGVKRFKSGRMPIASQADGRNY